MMRKVFAILFIPVLLLSLVHVSVATHFCGGSVAATKVSFSGELASCGMEITKEAVPVHENNISNRCCEDEISITGVFSKYINGGAAGVPAAQLTFNILKLLHADLSPLYSSENIDRSYIDTGPPGFSYFTSPGLQKLCVLRI